MESVKPAIDEFYTWIESKDKVLPSSALGKAIAYASGQKEKLYRYLEHEGLTPDNNIVECAIRPFTIGRKNWMFCDSPKGAFASANLYSLIETARINGREPNYNIERVLEGCLHAQTEKEWEKLLPWNIDF